MIALRLLDTILNSKAIALLFKITRSDGNALPIKFSVFPSDRVRSHETLQSGPDYILQLGLIHTLQSGGIKEAKTFG